ncbi:MAG: LamB/YcsF family protein [Ignavibacteria bacterium]|nr:LamB/YcsF family protein [Ignavibacteria bacterium]
MKNRIDINADVGERPETLADGSEEKLISLITSANIACGGHAGTIETMEEVVRLCMKHRVSIGAHPGYPDKKNFGRVEISIDDMALKRSLVEQIGSLCLVADRMRARVSHVKPHGALYNLAARNPEMAALIGSVVADTDKLLILIGLAESVALQVWKKMGLRVLGEAFADRRYESDGTLRSRKHPDALITNTEESLEQVRRIAREGIIVAIDGSTIPIDAQTICIHSDTPNSLAIAMAVRQRLEFAGLLR